MNTQIALNIKPKYNQLKENILSDFKKINSSYLIIAFMFIFGSIISLTFHIPISSIINEYSYDVLVIMISMELFTNLVMETGVMQLIAIKMADLSQGKKRLCLILFGIMMFFISAFLNNITAIMMILPIIFVMLKTLEVNKSYIYTFFAVILALSNTGGAASPIGDFPAIIILTSGLTDFFGYLTHAFPLFLITSLVLIGFWAYGVKRDNDDGGIRKLSILNLKSQYKNLVVHYDALKWIIFIFIGMFLSWSFIPQSIIPPEVIAIVGYSTALLVCSFKNININQKMDLKSVLTISSFLFFAEVISQTGLLSHFALFLQSNIENPKLLILLIMIITSLVAGFFSAGPAAAAMMPIITGLCQTVFTTQSTWISVLYAASICAGSSLFLWSATGGLILSAKIEDTNLKDNKNNRIHWGVLSYFKYGIVNYLIQIGIALVLAFVVIR